METKVFFTHHFTRQKFRPNLLQQVESIYLLQKTRLKALPCETMGENYLNDNVRFRKKCSKLTSVLLLCLLRVFMKQTLHFEKKQ